MLLQKFLAIIAEPGYSINSFPDNNELKAMLTVFAAAVAAGTLSKKQLRKLKWKMAWQYVKNKFTFKSKKGDSNMGLLILAIVLGLGCFGVAIALGMLKEFLILIGAVVLFFILFMGAKGSVNKN